jgi:uncharacterized protein (DUF952 family)
MAGPGDILHITTAEAWAAAQETGQVAPASLEAEGFVHCSTRAQLDATLARHFPGTGRLTLLVLDPDAVGDLRWEESRPGESFPHVYGPIPAQAVVAVEEVRAPGAT